MVEEFTNGVIRTWLWSSQMELLKNLWGMDTSGRLSTIFDNGDNIFDFLFVFCNIFSFLKKGLL